MLQKIAISRNSVFVSAQIDSENPISKELLLAALTNWASLGYSVTKELFEELSKLSLQNFMTLYLEVNEELLEVSGMRYSYKPFYPDFPNHKNTVPQAELLLQQLLHYWTGYEPEQDKNEQVEYLGIKKFMKRLSLATMQDIDKIFMDMIESKASLKPSQVIELKWYVLNNPETVIAMLPESFAFQEIGAVVLSELIKNGKTTLGSDLVGKYLISVTMILRIIVGLSDGDVSLATKTKLLRFNNKLKKEVVLAFGKTKGSIEQDILRYQQSWRLVFNLMHANAIKKTNPSFITAVAVARDNQKVRTFASDVQRNILLGEYKTVLQLLATRPTELLRKLDQLLSKADHDAVLEAFAGVAHECSSRALYQLVGFYRGRNNAKKRIFLPKGTAARGFVTDNDLKSLPEDVVDSVIDIASKALVQQYRTKEKIAGKVYVDPILKNYTLPLSLRSAARAMMTLGRGTRVSFGIDTEFLRLFTHWVNIPDASCDIDLSCYFLSESLEELGSIYYGNYHNQNFLFGDCAVHSGDKTNAPAPNGASEFVDINIQKMLDKNIRYAIMSLHNYTNQRFSDYEVANAGWMVREDLGKKGNLFEPTLVQERFDLNADTTYSIPVVFDLVTREAIWLDMCIDSVNWVNNINSTRVDTMSLLESMLEKEFPTLYDCFYAHALARADEVVNSREEATQCFDLTSDSIVNYQDTEQIMSRYL